MTSFARSAVQEHWETLILLVCGSALGIMAISCFYPYAPQEGDLISCWYPYVNDWLSKGLGEAIKNTEGQGKFPTQAILMITAMKVTGLPLLDALQYSRLFTGMLAVFGAFFVTVRLRIPKLWAFVFAILLNSHPMYYQTIRMNTQDASKPGFFMFSIFFMIGVLELPRGSWKSRLNFLGYVVCSSLLAMVRSIDALPLLVFGFFWSFHIYRPSNSKFSFKDYLTQSRQVIFLTGIPILLLIGLLIFGKVTVGHWGFSDGEPPQPWISYWYWKTLSDEWTSGVSKFKILEHAVFWLVNNVINKMSYFTDDFIFMNGASKILGVYRFVKDLETPGANLGEKIVNVGISLSILGAVFYHTWKDRYCKRVWTIFLYAGLGAWSAWTFLLNHYEPRYWTAVYLCWFAGLVGPVIQRFSRKQFENHKQIWVGTAAVLALSVLANFSNLMFAILPSASDRLAVARNWQRMARETCQKPENYIWRIPFGYWRWSTFKVFVAEACPRIEVLCLEKEIERCKYPENPEHKVVLDLPIDAIDPKHIY